MRSGNVLVVWRLDRLGRSLKQLIELMGERGEMVAREEVYKKILGPLIVALEADNVGLIASIDDKVLRYDRKNSDFSTILVDFLVDEREATRDAARYCLGRLAQEDSSIISPLLKALEESSDEIGNEITKLINCLIYKHGELIANAVFDRLVEIYENYTKETYYEFGYIFEMLKQNRNNYDNTIFRTFRFIDDELRYHKFYKIILEFSNKNIDYINLKLARANDRFDKLVAIIILGWEPEHGRRNYHFLVDSLVSEYGEIRGAAKYALQKIGADLAIPALLYAVREGREELRVVAKEALCNISYEMYEVVMYDDKASTEARQAAQLHPIETTGIGKLGERTVKAMPALLRFRDIGTECKLRKVNTFKLSSMSKIIGKSGRMVGLVMGAVSNFFHAYYREIEGIDILPDDDESMENPENFKLFERGQGKRGVTIYPLGWKAWELTCQYLDRWERRVQ